MAPWIQYHLPEELWSKIFVQQSMKTLVRLKCVCRLWDQFISSKLFIDDHLAYQKTSSSNTNKYFLLDYRDSYLDLDTVDMKPYNVHVYDMDDIFGRDPFLLNCLQIYGICNGLLCLSENLKYWTCSNRRIFIWNPVLRKGKKLPPLGSEFESKPPLLCFGNHGGDYKVIAVAPCLHMSPVYIYSLSTGCWKRLISDISCDGYEFVIRPYINAKLVNGVVYLLQVSPVDRRLVSFDLTSEIVRYIKMPQDFGFDVQYFMEEYGKSITLVSRNEHVVMMWVLRRLSDGSFIWDKVCSFKSKGRHLMGLIDSDKLVMMTREVSKGKSYFLYNTEDGFEKQLGTPRLDLLQLQGLYNFTESLVLYDAQNIADALSTRNEEKQKGYQPIHPKKLCLFLKNT